MPRARGRARAFAHERRSPKEKCRRKRGAKRSPSTKNEFSMYAAIPMEPKAATEAMASVRSTVARGVPRVTATQGPGQGAAFALTQSLATVGRHETNYLVLADARCSGVH